MHKRLPVFSIILAISLTTSVFAQEGIRAGVAWHDITPPLGTPSAGYGDRRGGPMTGVHDALEAGTLVLEASGQTLVFTGVDNLGFTEDMVAEIRDRAREIPGLENAHVLVGSSHTHAGGGAFMDNQMLAILFGPYNPERRADYIRDTIESIRKAASSLQDAKLGVGYRQVASLNRYRGDWPPNIETNATLTVIKVVTDGGQPLACLFNYPAHPTVLSGSNMSFSADFVGYARKTIEERIGNGVEAVFFNGAQADISPTPPKGETGFERAEGMGRQLGEVAAGLWNEIETKDTAKIKLTSKSVALQPQATSAGLDVGLPARDLDFYAITLDDTHALVTIPGELSTVLDQDIQRFARWLGLEHATVLGLTNGAVGYIVTSESFRHYTYESTVSFGGPLFGSQVLEHVYGMLHELEPEDVYWGRAPSRPAPAAAGK